MYDERELHFQTIRGALTPTTDTLGAPAGPYNPRGGAPSTTTYNYDLNGNMIEKVDAADTDDSGTIDVGDATWTFNWLFAERIGVAIGRIGERNALTIEYGGLVLVFTAYAYVENAYLAAGLYVVDHMFFALYIATTTYFHKIADPADLASSAGVSFTINHIAAVIIPAALGLVWVVSHSAVFLVGTGFAICSLAQRK